MTEKESVIVCKLGCIDYEEAWSLQRKIQDILIRAKRSEPSQKLAHVMLLVEHPHVYTLGKSGKAAHLLVDQEKLADAGASFVHVDRGGDITYHGPGQLILYPILDLDYYFTDIHRYLRQLEEVVIRTCANFDIQADRVEGKTGVWIKPTLESAPARKICAMGIRCSRWVTMHGIGFNLNTDLRRYDLIVPCGISDGDVTSLARETKNTVDEPDVHEKLLRHFSNIFDSDLTILQGIEANNFIKHYLSTNT